MKLKHLGWTLGALVLLAGIVTLVTNSRSSVHQRKAGDAVVDPEILAEAASLTIYSDERAAHLTLQRDGKLWRLAESGIPVDFDRLSSLTTSLIDLKYERFVSDNSDTIDRLELGRAELIIGTEGDPERFQLNRGQAGPSGGFFARVDGDDAVYLVNGALNLSTAPTSWMQRQPLALSEDDLQRIEFAEVGTEVLTLSREATEAAWMIAEGTSVAAVELPPSLFEPVNRLAGSLVGLSVGEPLARDEEVVDAALDQGASWRLTTFDGDSLAVHLGFEPSAENEEGEAEPGPAVVAIARASEAVLSEGWASVLPSYAFRLPEYIANRLTDPVDALKAHFTTPPREVEASEGEMPLE